MTRSAICTTGAVARMVMVLVVLLATICGWIAMPATRINPTSNCDNSVASACDTKNVRMTCSSYCVRFCVLSAATMIVRSFRTR